MTVKSNQKSPVGVRLPDELQKYLARKASESYRSLTAEIIMRLEQSRERDVSGLGLIP